MVFQGTIKLECTRKIKAYVIPDTVGCVLLYGYAVWFKECRCHLLTCDEYNLLWSAMSTIFCDHLRKTVGCYFDDIAIKSREKNNHLYDLRMMFDLIRAHQLKMNLTKSFLGVSRGKFLEFIVTSKEIHLDLDKIKTIQDMQPPKNLKELRGLQDRLAYICKFIVNLSGRCQPFTRLMKKGVSFVWDDACQKAFEDIKVYLTKSPVLVSPLRENHSYFM